MRSGEGYASALASGSGTAQGDGERGTPLLRYGSATEGSIAELHWYEAHGIGRREVKIKRLLRNPP